MQIMHAQWMSQANLQIRLPRELDNELTRVAAASKSDFVRQAIVEKLERERCRRMEQQWIQALTEDGGVAPDDDAWRAAEVWGQK